MVMTIGRIRCGSQANRATWGGIPEPPPGSARHDPGRRATGEEGARPHHGLAPAAGLREVENTAGRGNEVWLGECQKCGKVWEIAPNVTRWGHMGGW